ncbi:Uncharacterised protein [Neisseria meningitidis]|nr:Uncharacterised protein [Neisseria meningitidis]
MKGTKPQTVQIVRNRFTWCFSTLENSFSLSQGEPPLYWFLLIHYSIDKHIIFNIFNWIIVYLSKDNCLFLTNK